MIRILPMLSGDAVTSYEYSIPFEIREVIYALRFLYNARLRRWVLTITHPNGTPIVVGQPVIQGVNLLEYSRPGLRPRGFLVCFPRGDAASEREPELRDLGRTHALVYFERTEDLGDTSPKIPPKR